MERSFTGGVLVFSVFNVYEIVFLVKLEARREKHALGVVVEAADHGLEEEEVERWRFTS